MIIYDMIYQLAVLVACVGVVAATQWYGRIPGALRLAAIVIGVIMLISISDKAKASEWVLSSDQDEMEGTISETLGYVGQRPSRYLPHQTAWVSCMKQDGAVIGTYIIIDFVQYIGIDDYPKKMRVKYGDREPVEEGRWKIVAWERSAVIKGFYEGKELIKHLELMGSGPIWYRVTAFNWDNYTIKLPRLPVHQANQFLERCFNKGG